MIKKKTKMEASFVVTIIAVIILLILLVFLFWRWNTQAIYISVDNQVPADFPETGFSHQIFANLLIRFVNPQGNVNYQAWFDDKLATSQLDQYLAAVAAYSPENSVKRFPHKNDQLGYWVYTYNAQVIKSILDNWPLSSVTDLKAPVEIIQGLGFFYTRKFTFGGQNYSLYQVENTKIFDGEGDPRVHFILNCGSGSCPVLRPQLPVGDALEPFLIQSASDFIENSNNLRIDHTSSTLYLSTIFKWYKNDFLKSLKNDGDTPNLIDYLRSISRRSFLVKLKNVDDYQIIFIDYDWRVNQTKPSMPPTNENSINE